jgi:hypothetical protein
LTDEIYTALRDVAKLGQSIAAQLKHSSARVFESAEVSGERLGRVYVAGDGHSTTAWCVQEKQIEWNLPRFVR